MIRSLLRRPLIMCGKSAFGLRSILTIESTLEPGIWWQISRDKKVRIDRTIIRANRHFHYLELVYKNKVLRVPEHLLGFFFAKGVDRVCIIPQYANLPYDGCAETFFHEIELTRADEKPKLYTPKKEVRIDIGENRFIQFTPNKLNKTLTYTVGVDYTGVGSYKYMGSLDGIDHSELMCSRAYGRAGLRRTLARFLNREDQHVWFDSTDDDKVKKQKLREIAMHRLLDLLGALEHIRPPGGALVGSIVTRPFVGHETDIELLKKIREVGLEEVS